ncbi:MAG TPA: hypothetical protein VGF99_00825 [Myxococcota bacterium]
MHRIATLALASSFTLAAACATSSSTAISETVDTTTTAADPTTEPDPMAVAQTTLTTTLIVETSTPVAGGPLLVRQQVTNTTSTAQRFCTYHTLFEGLRNDILAVSVEGRAVDYRGIMAKRAPPTAKDFIVVAPGETKTSDPVDVSAGYPLPAGEVTVTFTGNGISGLPAGTPTIVQVPPGS